MIRVLLNFFPSILYFSLLAIVRGWTYILECGDGSFYTGSTNNLKRRIRQHKKGNGSNHTRNNLPVHLVYYEEFDRIDKACEREKQIQGWSRKKKEALIKGRLDTLKEISECKNNSH